MGNLNQTLIHPGEKVRLKLLVNAMGILERGHAVRLNLAKIAGADKMSALLTDSFNRTFPGTLPFTGKQGIAPGTMAAAGWYHFIGLDGPYCLVGFGRKGAG